MREWFKARNVWGAAINALSDEEAGRLAKAIWSYTMDGEIVDLQGAGKGIFALILMTLGQDEEHDSDVSAKRSIASKSKRKEHSEQLISIDNNCNQLISIADNKNKNKNKSKNKNKETDILFDRFWDAYPRHVNKQGAIRAFEKANVDESLLETILNAIERQKKSDQWTKDNGQFIPHPATWLNQRRWDDDVVVKDVKLVPAHQYGQRDYTGEQDEAMRRMLELGGA